MTGVLGGYETQNKVSEAVSELCKRPLTVLTYEMQIVQVAAHVIPQPIASAIENHTVLFAVVVVRLILAPGGLLHYFTWETSDNMHLYESALGTMFFF